MRLNYYERHLGDYARDTGHLSALEHGVYTLLLDRYYASESPIEASMAYDYARARTKQERAAADRVLAQFFDRCGDLYHSKRADAEIARRQARAERNREVGRLGGRPPVLRGPKPSGLSQETITVSSGLSEKTLTSNQKPVTNNQNPEREPPLAGFQPPDWVKDRLRMAGRPPTWAPANVVAFVAYYTGRAEPPEGYANAFVRWMLRERDDQQDGLTDGARKFLGAADA